MHPYRRLLVWQKAHLLAIEAHRNVDGIPYARYPGLESQLRRAATSIPTSIAEGSGRDTAPQFLHSLQVALGSARELDYLLLLAVELGAIGQSEHARLEARLDEVSRMLKGLRARVRSQPRAPAREGGNR